MNIVFLGGKEIGANCFLELITFVASQQEHQIIGLCPSSRGSKLRTLAEENGIPIFDSADDTPECDLFISVQYDQILKKEQISKAGELAVNLHMAPLPEYRGCNQFTLAIMNGDEEFGTTIHVLDEGVDSGDILFESRFPIPKEIWVDQLIGMTMSRSLLLFREALPRLLSGDFERRPQSSFADRRPTRFSYRSEIEQLKKIDLGMSRVEIERVIRATSARGFSGPYIEIGESRVELLKVAGDD